MAWVIGYHKDKKIFRLNSDDLKEYKEWIKFRKKNKMDTNWKLAKKVIKLNKRADKYGFKILETT
jgi:hypothetical protein